MIAICTYGFVLVSLIVMGNSRSDQNHLNSRGSFLVEICDNAIDDDLDGLIDLNDPDCLCPVITPKSLIPNPSFEERECCPSNRSQLNCASGWIQASEPTTDFLHMCGWMGWPDFPPPLPFPDGEGIMGFRDGRVIQSGEELNWKEYAGACLIEPLKADISYRFEFYVGFVDESRSPPINISFFGSTSCDNLPFGVGNDAFGCPTNGPGWRKLGSRHIGTSTSSEWIKTGITITPNQDIHAIAIGPDCNRTQAMRSTYYFFDNLVLDDLRSFEFKISEINHPCSEDFLLTVPSEEDLSYQWYKDGIALAGQTRHSLSKIYGEGDYQVRIQSDAACNITEAYTHEIPHFEEFKDVIICENETYPFENRILDTSGIYIGSFANTDGCDSIVELHLEILGQQQSQMAAKIFEGETFQLGRNSYKHPGQYDVVLYSRLGCDSLVNLSLSYYNVYFPNIFSPNGDGSNDRFIISGEEDLIEIKQIAIFDRWGKEVYSGGDFNSTDQNFWDGRINGRLVDPGIYTYISRMLMDDGLEREFTGTLMLIR